MRKQSDLRNLFQFIAGAMFVLNLLNACAAATPQVELAPTVTFAPPTATPTAIPPSPTPTLTPIPVLEGVCGNVLYPLLPGAEWVYQTSDPQNPARMIFQVPRVENDLAYLHVIDENANITTDDTVRCEEGAIVNLPLVYISLLLSDYLDGVLNTYQVSGITAPSLHTFEANDWHYTWEVEKLVEQSLSVELPGIGSGHILQSNTIKFKSDTTGEKQSINVPAGSFPQAILVENEMRAPITVGSTGVIFIVKYREWYEPNLGLLKIQTYSASLDYSGAPMPIPTNKALELVEYTRETP